MKKFALVALGVLGLASVSFGAERRPSREDRDSFHPHRVCQASDTDGRNYLGYDQNAGDDAMRKCWDRSSEPTSCYLVRCVDDVGFTQEFVAK